ncbi:MAG: segregation/condensation protein A [Candidatus Altiarchaeota archaeon]|nr:segregation/condensation protein A [Candidatus Altiarchaeota archaeon]
MNPDHLPENGNSNQADNQKDRSGKENTSPALIAERRDTKIDTLIETPELTWRDILYEVIKGMDPWDIDLCELASRYAKKVEEMQDMNFRIPANVILVSSVLLRMKADVLRPSETDPFIDNREAFDFMFNRDFAFLKDDKKAREYELQALLRPNRLITRRVTAEELIGAIQKALEERSEKKYKLEMQGGKRMLIVATDWDITAVIEEVYGRIMGILKEREFAVFSELAGNRDEMIRVFTSILHLSNKQKLSLRQERIFEEIYISPPVSRL